MLNTNQQPATRGKISRPFALLLRGAVTKIFPFLFPFPSLLFHFSSRFRYFDAFSPSAAGRRRDGDNGNPFRTLIDLQDALRTKSVFVLDGSAAPGISNGTLAQDVPVLASGSGGGGGGGGRRRGTSGGGDGAASAAAATTVAALSAASVASSSHSSSGSNNATANIDNNAQQSSTAAAGPLGAAAHLAGGRGYTAEAWEPTRRTMLDEQQVLAARLRAVLEDALERDVRENGARKEEGVNTSSTKEGASVHVSNEVPTLLQRNAHAVLQLLGVTEAIHGGYVLQDYAAPYMSRLARREHRHGQEMDGAAQLLREHRSALARETAVDGGAGDGAEQDRAEVEVEEEEMMRPSTGLRAGTRHRVTRSMESVASSTNRARVTADEYAKKYLPSHRSSSAKSGRGRATTATNASRTSAAAAAAGGRQYEGPRRTKKKGKKSKTKQPQVAAGAGGSNGNGSGNGNGGARREKRHLEKTAEWDSILRQARQQERQDQHEKQEHLLEILRYQAMEAEAQAEAQAQAQNQAKAKAKTQKHQTEGREISYTDTACGDSSASLKRPADEIQGAAPPPTEKRAKLAATELKRAAPGATSSSAGRPIQSVASDDKDDLPIMQAHKARKASAKYAAPRQFVFPAPSRKQTPTSHEARSMDQKATSVAEPTKNAAATATAVASAAPSAKSLPQHDLFAPLISRDESGPSRKQESSGVSATVPPPPPPPPFDTTFKAPTKPAPPSSASIRLGRNPGKKAMKCHHCRNTTNEYRRCSYWKINGTQCRFVYCQTCLEGIYDHVSQNGPWEQCTSDKEWHCPSCLNKCQCKPCATKREKEEQRKMKIASSGFGDRERRSRRGGGPSDFAHMF